MYKRHTMSINHFNCYTLHFSIYVLPCVQARHFLLCFNNIFKHNQSDIYRRYVKKQSIAQRKTFGSQFWRGGKAEDKFHWKRNG